MVKRVTIAATVAAAMAAFLAGPGAGVASADFVCPVMPVSQAAKDHSNAGFIEIADGDTSILPGRAGDMANSPVDVGPNATNGGGSGAPDGAHSTPGDTDYTAIWNQ